jgi:hypothetical protein
MCGFSSGTVRIELEEETGGISSCIEKETNQKLFLPSVLRWFARRIFLLGSEA